MNEKNVRLTVADIGKWGPVLKDMSDAGGIKIVGALYATET